MLRHLSAVVLCFILVLMVYTAENHSKAARSKSKSRARAAALAEDNAAGPRLTDPVFFNMLDLSLPGLAAVKSDVETSDWSAATRALAQYLRTRQTPRWDVSPMRPAKRGTYRNRDAADALRHRLSSIGILWQFGERIDWKFNPTTQPDSKWAANHEWTWQLNRHAAWVDLCAAWRATGDEKYAAEFASELRSWVRECPVPVQRAENTPFSRWRTIEAGIRTGSVWPGVFFGFLNAKSFDDEAVVLMVKSFVEHAQYLTKFKTKGNWLTMESNGLYHVGALFPEFKEAKLWRETAIGRLYAELDIQVYPDGAQIELAPGYHGVALRNVLGPVDLVPLTGFELPKEYLAKIEKMFSYFLYSMQPTRLTPPLNDSGAGDVRRSLAEGFGLFPQRRDFQWVATDGAQGTMPDHTSHEFPYAGQLIMRSGWDRSALWLCMDAGPFGFGHQHEDKLSVLLTAYGKSLLVEGGVYTYDASEWRRYVLSSRAHNLIMVDGLDQARRRSPAASWVVKTPLPHTWKSTAEYDYAQATYDEGWGIKGEKIANHTRQVWFLKAAKCFVVVDDLEPLDGKEHSYEALFHLDAPEAGADGLRVTTKNDGANLTLLNLGADSVKIVKGQKEPVVQGWIPDGSKGYGGVRPIPTAIFSKRGAGKVHLVTVLYPTPAGKGCPIQEVQETTDGIRFKMEGGKTEAIRLER